MLDFWMLGIRHLVIGRFIVVKNRFEGVIIHLPVYIYIYIILGILGLLLGIQHVFFIFKALIKMKKI